MRPSFHTGPRCLTVRREAWIGPRAWAEKLIEDVSCRSGLHTSCEVLREAQYPDRADTGLAEARLLVGPVTRCCWTAGQCRGCSWSTWDESADDIILESYSGPSTRSS